jgi:hypothetical protein
MIKTKEVESQIKTKALSLNDADQINYLRGLRDGADLAALIAEDNKWNLAGTKALQDFIDFLDSKP